jgi:hypothetical protein
VLQIEDTIISLDLLECHFSCDLPACRGACCIEGESGAPLEVEEVSIIEGLLPIIWEDLTPAARTIIDQHGISYTDSGGETVAALINGEECIFAIRDHDGCHCAIESAYRLGRITFPKPISCHLYPIRVRRHATFRSVNYDRWEICPNTDSSTALPLYKYLREPLIRKFGNEWYRMLETFADEYFQSDRSFHRG